MPLSDMITLKENEKGFVFEFPPNFFFLAPKNKKHFFFVFVNKLIPITPNVWASGTTIVPSITCGIHLGWTKELHHRPLHAC